MCLKANFFMSKNQKKVITFGCRLNNLESELIDLQLSKESIDNVLFLILAQSLQKQREKPSKILEKSKKKTLNQK